MRDSSVVPGRWIVADVESRRSGGRKRRSAVVRSPRSTNFHQHSNIPRPAKLIGTRNLGGTGARIGMTSLRMLANVHFRIDIEEFKGEKCANAPLLSGRRGRRRHGCGFSSACPQFWKRFFRRSRKVFLTSPRAKRRGMSTLTQLIPSETQELVDGHVARRRSKRASALYPQAGSLPDHNNVR